MMWQEDLTVTQEESFGTRLLPTNTLNRCVLLMIIVKCRTDDGPSQRPISLAIQSWCQNKLHQDQREVDKSRVE